MSAATEAMEMYGAVRCMLALNQIPAFYVDRMIAVVNKMAAEYGDKPFVPLVDLTRAGNLSPEYLLAQDRARRETAAPTRTPASAERGAA